MMRNCRQTTFPWTAASSLNRALRTSGEKIVYLNCSNIESIDPQKGLDRLWPILISFNFQLGQAMFNALLSTLSGGSA